MPLYLSHTVGKSGEESSENVQRTCPGKIYNKHIKNRGRVLLGHMTLQKKATTILQTRVNYKPIDTVPDPRQTESSATLV